DGSGRRGNATPARPPPGRATSAPAPALRCVERIASLLPWRSSPQFCHDWRRRGSSDRLGADEKKPGADPGSRSRAAKRASSYDLSESRCVATRLVRARLGARLAVWLLDVVRAARDARELVWSPLLSVS